MSIERQKNIEQFPVDKPTLKVYQTPSESIATTWGDPSDHNDGDPLTFINMETEISDDA